MKSTPARISFLTSPSHPSLTPSIILVLNPYMLVGVGKAPLVDRGLLLPLRDSDNVGVADPCGLAQAVLRDNGV